MSKLNAMIELMAGNRIDQLGMWIAKGDTECKKSGEKSDFKTLFYHHCRRQKDELNDVLCILESLSSPVYAAGGGFIKFYSTPIVYSDCCLLLAN